MSGPRTFEEAFAGIAGGMVAEHHVGDVLAQLLADCAELVDATAVALLVSVRPGELALLGSTSHEATLLEMLQAQSGRGPCVDCIEDAEHVSGEGAPELIDRWDDVGQAIIAAGFQSADAYPMRWRGRALGGLNVFRQDPDTAPEESDRLCQTFADVATLVLVQSSEITRDQITARVHEAISARIQVEQAKGVLAQLHHLELAAAYDLLRQLASDDDRSLTETARHIVRAQYEG